MKQVIQEFWKFFEAMSQARAAAVLARAGKIAQVKALYAK